MVRHGRIRLAVEFGVPRSTVHLALSSLRDEGVLVACEGRITVAINSPVGETELVVEEGTSMNVEQREVDRA